MKNDAILFNPPKLEKQKNGEWREIKMSDECTRFMCEVSEWKRFLEGCVQGGRHFVERFFKNKALTVKRFQQFRLPWGYIENINLGGKNEDDTNTQMTCLYFLLPLVANEMETNHTGKCHLSMPVCVCVGLVCVCVIICVAKVGDLHRAIRLRLGKFCF